MNVLDEFKNYKREFIHLSRTTILMMHIFEKERDFDIEDMVLEDNEAYYKYTSELPTASAKQFIQQLEGNECVLFIKALRDECDNYLVKDKERIEKMKEKLKL